MSWTAIKYQILKPSIITEVKKQVSQEKAFIKKIFLDWTTVEWQKLVLKSAIKTCLGFNPRQPYYTLKSLY